MKYEIIVKAKAKPEDKKKDQQRKPAGWDHRSGREDTFRPRERPHVPGPSGLY